MSYSVYQPSGVVPRSVMPPALGCFALTPPAAALYAWLIHLLPFFFNFFICFAFAFLLTHLVKRVCANARVRNPWWAGLFGLLLGLFAWLIQWPVWIALQADADQSSAALLAGALHMASHPATAFNQVLNIWSAENWLTKSVMVLAWFGELWTLLFFPHYLGKMRAEELFDESTGRWAEYDELPEKLKLVGKAALMHFITESSASLANVLVREPDEASKKFSRLRVYRGTGSEILVSFVTVEIRGEHQQEHVVESSPGTYLRVPKVELDALLAAISSAGMQQADPPELASAITHLQAGEFQAAYEEALPFIASLNNHLYCDANRICAIVCSETAQWPKATAYWQALFACESSAHNALQCATSSVMADQVEQGMEWAERARALNAESEEMSGISILTNMLSALSRANHVHAAMPLLEQLRDWYTHLHVTDPTFLFGHRMPLFHVFLEKSAEIVDKVLDKGATREWYASMLPDLDERGKAELMDWLQRAPAQA
ncbi:hypothetical protein LK542_11375 [Massilia sp. IC2-477]|uniref:hypothetical protein n=1 Tax=Massilia sp. IC2-477 TaxID=2887198 RepID=UPI001D127EF2|nr:hypothetical protein [Massilia sp. IC2-477]MCC2956215.1 hypothetical protein [Massilia sp. IC2-477]